MCLTPSHKHPKIAKEDIIVYKVLSPKSRLLELNRHVGHWDQILVSDDHEWYSPFRKTPFDITTMATTKLGKAYTDGYTLAVDEGIHSFGSLPQALHMVEENRMLYRVDCPHAVFKAVIPAGSKFFKGFFDYQGHHRVSYASNQLIIQEKLN